VIGGGAAGVFAAIRCKELAPHSSVILLEKTNQLLSKVRISGGGRCNVTHACFDPFQLVKHYPRGNQELIGPLHSFQPKDVISWFQERGIRLKTEEDGRIFPDTDSSETIINCLLQSAARIGVEIRKQQRIQTVQKTEQGFLIELQEGERIAADSLLLATGSAPWGHDLVRRLGHTIIEPVPSLFTFNVPSSPLLDLSGISVPQAIVELKETGLQQRGPLLLTHWGFSGPAVLKLSAWAARELNNLDYKATLLINWTCSENKEILYQSLLKHKKEHPSHPIPQSLPGNLFVRLLSSLNIDPATLMNQLANRTLFQLAEKLYSDPYLIEGKTTYKQEFVTAGGICLKEISFKSMESRINPGLYFAGEILNIDGVTGGFNFQNAWTTGWLAGTAMSRR